MSNEYNSDLGVDYSLNLGNNYNQPDSSGVDYSVDLTSSKRSRLARSTELKRKRLYREDELKYEQDGTLVNDSDAMLRVKALANQGISVIDWGLEASENIADFGQGDLIGHYDKFKAERDGKTYNMGNKDFLGAGETSRDELLAQYDAAVDDPNAEGGVYNLRKFDGYNPDGTIKYIYKVGYAKAGAADRYKTQWVQDGFDIIGEKRFAGALDWENKFHALDSNLAERTLGSTDVMTPEGRMSRDEASGINFGGGKTELYNTDVMGLDTGSQEQYDENLRLSQIMQQEEAERPWDSNFIDAAQAATVGLLSETADAVLDVVTPGDNTLLNDYGREWADKTFGYDSKYASSAINEADAAFRRGDILEGIGKVIKSAPSYAAESLPWMLAMTYGPKKFTAASTLAKEVALAKKAKTASSTIAKMEAESLIAMGAKNAAVYNKYKDVPNTLRGLNILSKNLGVEAINLTQTNNILDERIQAKLDAGEDPNVSVGEATALYMFEMPFTLLDKVAFQNIVKGNGAGKTIKKAFDKMPDSMKQNFATKLLEKGGPALASMAEEGTQEYLQTWGEIIGGQYGIDGKEVADILSLDENQKQARIGALAGIGAGGLFHAGSQLPGGLIKGAGALKEARIQKNKVRDVEDATTNLDETDFNLYIQDEEQRNFDIEESANNKEEIIRNLEKDYNSIEDMINSTNEQISFSGQEMQQEASGNILENKENANITANELAAHNAKTVILEETQAAEMAMFKTLGIPIGTDEYTNLSDNKRSDVIRQAYLNASTEDKRTIHAEDNVQGHFGVMIATSNIFSKDNETNFIKEQEKIFKSDKGLEATVVRLNTEIEVDRKNILENKDRIENYKAAREEAIDTGSAVNEFTDKDIDVEALDTKPETFIQQVKSFVALGTKSKIMNKIKHSSDASLEKILNHPEASRCVKSAVMTIQENRKDTKKNVTNTSQEYDDYQNQISETDTRFTKESLQNVEEIIKNKKYQYQEERNDAIRLVNQAASSKHINSAKRQELLLAIGFNSSRNKTKPETIKFRNTVKKLWKDFDNKKINEEEYTNELAKAVLEYGPGLKKAGETNLDKVEQISKYNKKTFTEIRKYASKKVINDTQERDRVLKMIEVAKNAGHISEKQANVLSKKIKQLSKNATKNEEVGAYDYLKENIIKTEKDLAEAYKEITDERDRIDAERKPILDKRERGEDITKEEEDILIKTDAELVKLGNASDKYVYFSQQEKDINNISQQYHNIEFKKMNKEESTKDKEAHQIEFEFC